MSINTEAERAGMARAGRVVALTLHAMREALRPGVSTAQLDAVAARVFVEHGARSAPHLVYGFPGTVLISVNDEVVHGIPGTRLVLPGDVVALDVTAEVDGYIADAATTVCVPPTTRVAERLCACTRSAFREATRAARPGAPVNAIGRAMDAEVRRWGFRTVRELHSHGVGRTIHEEPTIPNYYDPRVRSRLTEGLVITIEPIITAGTGRVYLDEDGWTIRTRDGAPSAHYEHTLVIGREGPALLTAL